MTGSPGTKRHGTAPQPDRRQDQPTTSPPGLAALTPLRHDVRAGGPVTACFAPHADISRLRARPRRGSGRQRDARPPRSPSVMSMNCRSDGPGLADITLRRFESYRRAVSVSAAAHPRGRTWRLAASTRFRAQPRSRRCCVTPIDQPARVHGEACRIGGAATGGAPRRAPLGAARVAVPAGIAVPGGLRSPVTALLPCGPAVSIGRPAARSSTLRRRWCTGEGR